MTYMNRIHLGRAVLLGWLETQLGLPASGRSPLQRQADLLSALEKEPPPAA